MPPTLQETRPPGDAPTGHSPEVRLRGARPGAPGRAVRHPALDYWFVTSTHALIDIFPIFFTSLLIVLDERLAMTKGQETAVLVITPIFSGAFQPLFAWLGDRFDSRLPGPIGLAIGAVCISAIGFAQTFEQLVALQIIGVVGTGMYHPTAAACAGQMGSMVFRRGRAVAMSLFIAAGMVGHTIGPILSTRVHAAFGMEHLAWLILPSLVMAAGLYVVLRHTPHRPHDHRTRHASLTDSQSRERWAATILLTVQNALRYCANIGMLILFNYLAKSRIPDDAPAAATLNGNLSAALTLGMGVGAVLAGPYIRQGSERSMFFLTAIFGAVFMALISPASRMGGSGALAYLPAYGCAFCCAIGFFATIPSSIGLGHRLLPSRAGLVTSLLMGVGWMFGALSRPVSTMVMGDIDLDDSASISHATMDRSFLLFAVLLAVSGVLALAMPRRAIQDVATHA